jgi:hypothetical protein
MPCNPPRGGLLSGFVRRDFDQSLQKAARGADIRAGGQFVAAQQA